MRLTDAVGKSRFNMKIHLLPIGCAILASAYFVACVSARPADIKIISASATNPVPRLVIVKAVYGDLSTPDSSVDVTGQVAGMVTNNAVTVDASDDNFGDPASGITKQLKVDFTFDGVPGTKSVYERGKLRISLKDKPDAQTGASRLVIHKAVYGALPNGDSVDVTTIVAGMVHSNSLIFTVNNDDLGDPATYQSKQLRVDYMLNGTNESQTIAEGKTLEIPPNSK